MSEIFITIFRNKRDDPVMIDDYNGVLFTLKPGEGWELKSTSPRTLYSRFSEVVFRKGDVIDVKENRAWKNPYADFWCLELVNVDGAHSESFQIQTPREAGEVVGLSPNGYIEALKGFPRIIPVDIHCKLVKYARIEWREEEERVPVEDAPGYWETRTTLKKILIDRPASELRKIAKEREQEAVAQVRNESTK
jgi:hypothetical protein